MHLVISENSTSYRLIRRYFFGRRYRLRFGTASAQASSPASQSRLNARVPFQIPEPSWHRSAGAGESRSDFICTFNVLIKLAGSRRNFRAKSERTGKNDKYRQPITKPEKMGFSDQALDGMLELPAAIEGKRFKIFF